MTQEDKQLLLKDLSARLLYGVKVYINSCIDEQNQMELFDVNFASETIGVGNEKWTFRAIPIVDIDDNTKIVRPYLRPMSSMTKEERTEYFNVIKNSIDFYNCPKSEDVCFLIIPIDWLNKNHFDYRGLIEKGLAIEAKEGMYDLNED